MQVTDRTLILTTVSGAGVPACRRTAVLLRCFVAVAMLMMSDTAAAQEYVLGPDSQRRPGVPTGVVTAYRWTSRIFPGTTRDYWIYVPAQYKPSTPAALMVFQDGDQFQNPKGSYRVPIVFDNLIHRSEMPVTIGVFINPGVLPSADTNTPARNNRSFEYDAVTDDYARFLLEEILPEVAKYNISDDPNSRAIGGVSSGAICAFTSRMASPRCLPARSELLRQLYEPAGWRRLHVAHSQNGAEAHPGVLAERQEGHEHLCGQLVHCQSASDGVVRVHGL
jgi:hypothetical protein